MTNELSKFQEVLDGMPLKDAGTFDVTYWFFENHEQIRSAFELAELMQWKPIETAPRDELVLVKAHWDGIHTFVGYLGVDGNFYQPRQIHDGLNDMTIIEPYLWTHIPERDRGAE